jgi:hypothetical protein
MLSTRGCLLALPPVVLAGLPPATAAEKEIRLFVLSGQSNMAGMDPRVSFTAAVVALPRARFHE